MPHSVFIKICGITNKRDALLAAEAGADGVGVIGVPGTPRYVSPDAFLEITQDLPESLKRVIVVNRPEDADSYAADYIQHYADSLDPNRSLVSKRNRIRAFRIRDITSLQELVNYTMPHDFVLLDAYHPHKLGGSGESFDWTLAVQAKPLATKPIMLAGGLAPDTIRQALQQVRPYGVDVSSGVESSPGIKDPAKIRAFIQAVRDWEQEC